MVKTLSDKDVGVLVTAASTLLKVQKKYRKLMTMLGDQSDLDDDLDDLSDEIGYMFPNKSGVSSLEAIISKVKK